MTERVIETLEIIDIQHDQATMVPIARGARQFTLQRLFQVASVEQPGQRVADRLLAQGFAQLQICKCQGGRIPNGLHQLLLWFRQAIVSPDMQYSQDLSLGDEGLTNVVGYRLLGVMRAVLEAEGLRDDVD